MTGVVGGRLTGRSLRRAFDCLHDEPWYRRDRLEAGAFGLGAAAHGSRDPAGTTLVNDGARIGVLYGSITSPASLADSTETLVDRVLERPRETLSAVEGPFLLAAADADADRVVVATDKLGTRRCYYTTTGHFRFGTSVGSLLAAADDPTLDRRALRDLLTIGQVWNGRTLVESVDSIPPGAVLVHENDTTRLERYWRPSFDDTDRSVSTAELVREYRRVVTETAATLPDGSETGLWLSGGLDSRSLAAVLHRHCNLVTYTYDANPPTGDNLALADRVATTLGVPNKRVTLSPDRFVSVLEDGIELVDGLVPWVTFLNLTASFDLPDRTAVAFEGSGQGGLLGNDVWRSDLQRASSPADALYRSHNYVDRETAASLVDAPGDPLDSYRDAVAATAASSFDGTVLEAYRQNFYPYGEFASNQVARSQTGTRVPVADGDFLACCARIPRADRTRAVPLTRGKVPYGTARYKLELVRRLDSGLEHIPYERTGVAPAKPMWQHAAGFVVSTGLDRLRSRPTYGGWTLAGRWYRDCDALRTKVDGLLDAACARPFVDGDVVADLRREHQRGDEDNVKPLACLTTAEHWLQTHLDA